MPRRKSLLGTPVLLVAALVGPPLSPLAAAAPTSARPAATNDGVPRLVRTARLEADLPASCYPSVTATLSADGHTAILGCVLWASEYASTKRAWVVLSDAFPDGRWRIVGRFEAYGRADLSADGRTIATGDYTYRDVRIYAPKDGTWREIAVVDPGSAYRCCDSFDLSDDGASRWGCTPECGIERRSTSTGGRRPAGSFRSSSTRRSRTGTSSGRSCASPLGATPWSPAPITPPPCSTEGSAASTG